MIDPIDAYDQEFQAYMERLDELEGEKVAYLSILYGSDEGESAGEVFRRMANSEFRDELSTSAVSSSLISCIPGRVLGNDYTVEVMRALEHVFDHDDLRAGDGKVGGRVEEVETPKDFDPKWKINYEEADVLGLAVERYVEREFTEDGSDSEIEYLVSLDEDSDGSDIEPEKEEFEQDGEMSGRAITRLDGSRRDFRNSF